jgi:hypothetical protein
MEYAPADYVVIEVVTLGVGGSILAIGGLWLEARLGGSRRRPWAGILAAGLACSAVLFWAQGRPPGQWWPLVALAAFCAAAQASALPRVRQWARRLFEPRMVWGLLLIVSPAVSWYLIVQADRAVRLPLFLQDVSVDSLRFSQERAVTDRGREIQLFAYGESESLEENEKLVLAEEHFMYQVIRLAKPDLTCNCHGWVFTGGRAGIPSSQVDAILLDNGYVEVLAPEDGDLVVYRYANGTAIHTGLVRYVGSDGVILIESKWGPLGVYLHPPEAQPWGHEFAFYRSLRQGHLLRLTPEEGSPSGSP